MSGLYLDYNATSPLEPRALEAMQPWLGAMGNASSVHAFGRKAREAVETARDQVASLLGASPPEVVFTALGTEANNAVFSAIEEEFEGGRILLSSFEHPSISAAAVRLAERGFEVVELDPDSDGVVQAESFAANLTDDTRLVCLMLANNELGTIQPVSEVIELAHARGARVLCDAVQAVGKVPLLPAVEEADYVVIGAHKFYGPLGAAAIRIRRGAPWGALLIGGSQERSRRAGTVNVPAIVGMGAASALVAERQPEWAERMARTRDHFESRLAELGECVVHGEAAERLPNTSNVAVLGTRAEALMVRLDLRGFAVSTGSACASGTVEPSRTLKAMGLSDDEALATLRISLGKETTPAEMDAFFEALSAEASELRAQRAEALER